MHIKITIGNLWFFKNTTTKKSSELNSELLNYNNFICYYNAATCFVNLDFKLAALFL